MNYLHWFYNIFKIILPYLFPLKSFILLFLLNFYIVEFFLSKFAYLVHIFKRFLTIITFDLNCIRSLHTFFCVLRFRAIQENKYLSLKIYRILWIMICVLLYHLKSSSTCKISKYLKLDILNFLLIIPIYLFLFIFIYFLLILISLEWGFFWAMFFHFAVLVLASQLWWMVRYFSKRVNTLKTGWQKGRCHEIF